MMPATAAASAPDSTGSMTFSAVSGTGFTVTWPAVTSAAAFNVLITTKSGGVTTTPVNNVSVTATTYTASGLTAHRAYEVTVTATDSGGSALSSIQGSVVTATGTTVSPVGTVTVNSSGVVTTILKYSWDPAFGSAVTASDTYHNVYTRTGDIDKTDVINNITPLQWYIQSGGNGGMAALQTCVNSMRLFDLTNGSEVTLNYGDFAAAASAKSLAANPGSWSASAAAPVSVTSGDFTVTKTMFNSMGFVVRPNVGSYLTAGHSYAVEVGPEWNSLGGTLQYLDKVYLYKFTMKSDTTAPAWNAGTALNVGTVGSDRCDVEMAPGERQCRCHIL